MYPKRVVLSVLAVLFVGLLGLPADAVTFNPNAATTVGNEWFATEQSEQLLPAAVSYLSTATETVDSLTLPIGVTGADAELTLEVYESGDEVPGTVTTTTFRPNSDLQIGGVDSEDSSWVDTALTTNNLYANVDEAVLSVADWVTYFAGQAAAKRWRLNFATAGALWPANQRVVGGRVRVVANREEINGRLRAYYWDGSDAYLLGTVTATPQRQTLNFAFPENNPATGYPWTRAEIQAFDSTSAIQLRTKNVNKQKNLFIYQLWMELDWVAEDRVAVGTVNLSEQDVAATAFTLRVPNSGADNWAKATATDYTMVLRRTDGFGLARWRFLSETAEVSEALLRPDRNVGLPVSSYAPQLDARGLVSRLNDRMDGRGLTFYQTRTDAAISVDGQPYEIAPSGTPAEPSSAQSVGQSFQAPATATYTQARFLIGIGYVTDTSPSAARPATPTEAAALGDLNVSIRNNATGAYVGTSVTVTVEDAFDFPAVAGPGPNSAALRGLSEYRLATIDLTGVSLTAATVYNIYFEAFSVTMAFGTPFWAILPLGSGPAIGGAAGFGGTTYGTGTDTPGAGRIGASVIADMSLLLSTQPTAPTSLAAGTSQTPTVAAAEDGAGCTIDSIETIGLGWTPTALAAAFGRYEIQRLGFDGATWETIYDPTDEAVAVAVDWESRRGQTETYRLRAVRTGDWVPSAWTAEESALAENGAEDVIIGSNHAQTAFAYTRDPDYQWTHPQAQETFALAGTYGQVVQRETEDRGDTFPLPIVLFAGEDETPEPTIPGRMVFEPLRDFLRSDVPHFAVCDRDGWRWFADVAMPDSSRTEAASNYRATLQVTETQQTPTPYDLPVIGEEDLQAWGFALANRDETPAVALAVGDSFTEGHAADTAPHRWSNLVQDGLRATYPVDGDGFGYYPAAYAASIFPAPGTGTGTVNNFRGLGLRSVTMAAGNSRTFANMEGTTARIWFSSLALAAGLTVTIDGGAPVAVPTISGTASYHDTFQDIATTAGTHTIVVARDGGGGFNPEFCGIQMFDGDETSGIQILDAGHSGFTMANFAQGATGGSASISDIEDWVDETNASLIILAPFINEWRASTAVATAKTNAQTVITNLLLGNPNADLLLIGWQEPTAANQPGAAVAWQSYITAIREMSVTNSAAFLDFTQESPYPVDPGGLHPTTVAHAQIAAVILARLSVL